MDGRVTVACLPVRAFTKASFQQPLTDRPLATNVAPSINGKSHLRCVKLLCEHKMSAALAVGWFNCSRIQTIGKNSLLTPIQPGSSLQLRIRSAMTYTTTVIHPRNDWCLPNPCSHSLPASYLRTLIWGQLCIRAFQIIDYSVYQIGVGLASVISIVTDALLDGFDDTALHLFI